MALDVRHTFGDPWESHMQLVVTGGLNRIHLKCTMTINVQVCAK